MSDFAQRIQPDIVKTIPAGEIYKVRRSWRSFHCVAVTTDKQVLVGVDGAEPQLMLRNGMGGKLEAGTELGTEISFFNTGVTAQTIEVVTSTGEIVDNRLSLVGGTLPVYSLAPDSYDFANTVATTTAIKTIGLGGLGSTQVGTLIIQNLGPDDVYISPNPALTSANAIKLGLNQTFDVYSACEWYARTASGTADLRVVRLKKT